MTTHVPSILMKVILCACAAFFCNPARADINISDSDNIPAKTRDSDREDDYPESSDNDGPESIFPESSRSLSESHFTWGGEFGASIDLSGYDTSTFDVDIVLGYKNNYFRILGIGAGVHRAFGTGDNFVPVYAVMRTSFSTKPRLLFMSLKAGYSFNTMGDAPTFGDANASLGCGINLAMTKRFKSHIILAYEFRHFNKRHKNALNIHADDISLATLSFGVNF